MNKTDVSITEHNIIVKEKTRGRKMVKSKLPNQVDQVMRVKELSIRSEEV